MTGCSDPRFAFRAATRAATQARMQLTSPRVFASSFLLVICAAAQERPADPEAGFRAVVAMVRNQEHLMPRAVHYAHRDEEAGGAAVRREAWTLEDGTLLKSAIEKIDASGSELTEYSIDDNGGNYFVFRHTTKRQ